MPNSNPEIASETKKRTARVLMFNVTLDQANWWFDALNVVLFVGAVVVAIATYGSVQMAAVKERYSDERTAANEAETSRANAEAAKANERTAGLERDAALAKERVVELEKGVAEANARAAEAQLALEKFRAPRTLSSAQQDTIVEKLRPFAGQKYDVAINAGDAEATSLAEAIERVLERAGWVQTAWTAGGIVFNRTGRPALGLITQSGVYLQIDGNSRARFGHSEAMLASSLNSEGISTKAESGDLPHDWNKDVIHVIVGGKP